MLMRPRGRLFQQGPHTCRVTDVARTRCAPTPQTQNLHAQSASEGRITYSGAQPDDPTLPMPGTSLSTTTDELGEFSFDVFTGLWFFESLKEDTWGFIELYAVPTAGRSDLEIVVAADAHVAQIGQTLMVDIDDTKGMVLLFFEPPGGSGGETATLSESYDFSFTFDADGEPVLSDDVLAGDEEPVLVFGGVDLTEELTVTPVSADGENTCDLEYPGAVYPVMAKAITVVDATCAPL
jgi:hypothetical protein